MPFEEPSHLGDVNMLEGARAKPAELELAGRASGHEIQPGEDEAAIGIAAGAAFGAPAAADFFDNYSVLEDRGTRSAVVLKVQP